MTIPPRGLKAGGLALALACLLLLLFVPDPAARWVGVLVITAGLGLTAALWGGQHTHSRGLAERFDRSDARAAQARGELEQALTMIRSTREQVHRTADRVERSELVVIAAVEATQQLVWARTAAVEEYVRDLDARLDAQVRRSGTPG